MHATYDDEKIKTGTENLLQHYPHNRLVKHLMENCCMTYHCPAARNFSLSRWECPVPSSPACNANCIGCISFQPEEETIVSTQDRLTFKPSAEEIVEFTVPHLMNAPFPIVSFGQGCEGEPLLMWETIKDAIIEIRKHTQRGSININTNGSMPKAVKALCEAGLNSIRVSTNSARKDIYTKYYRPNNYQFEDIIESLKVVRGFGGWTSINYFVFPGMTDSIEEYEALAPKLIHFESSRKALQYNINILNDQIETFTKMQSDKDFYVNEKAQLEIIVENTKLEVEAATIKLEEAKINCEERYTKWIEQIVEIVTEKENSTEINDNLKTMLLKICSGMNEKRMLLSENYKLLNHTFANFERISLQEGTLLSQLIFNNDTNESFDLIVHHLQQ